MRRLQSSLAAVALLSAIAACDSAGASGSASLLSKITLDSVARDSISRAREDSINRAQPGYVVDSVLPVDEEIRRFSAKVGGAPVAAFANASESRDALVARVVAAVARGDTVEMIKMLVSPREYLDLIYPSSPYTHAPQRLSPELAWMQLAASSRRGFIRLAQRRGRQAIELTRYTCPDTATREGENTFWANCTLHLVDADGTASSQRWFGAIVERGGKFKILTFANQF